MGRGGEILHPFEISGSEDDNIRIVLVFFGHEGNGIAAVLVVKSELYPLVKVVNCRSWLVSGVSSGFPPS